MKFRCIFQDTVIMAFLVLIVFMNSCSSQVVNENLEKKGNMLDLFLKDVERIENPDGFIVPCLAGAERNRNDNQIFDTKSLVPIFATGFAPRDCDLKDFDHYEKLAGLPRTGWRVKSIVGYRTENRYFQYSVFFVRDGIAAITELTYLDVNGDGKLRIAFQSANLKKPIIADWLTR